MFGVCRIQIGREKEYLWNYLDIMGFYQDVLSNFNYFLREKRETRMSEIMFGENKQVDSEKE